MKRPDPKKFCCTTMQLHWRGGVCGWIGSNVGINTPIENTGRKLWTQIAYCPWCGFQFKVKDEEEK